MTLFPKLAVCNFLTDVDQLKKLGLNLGFSGVDWSFTLQDLPGNALEEARLAKKIARLQPFEIRYHCAFNGLDLGDAEAHRADEAMEIFRRACRLVRKLNGRYMTIHLGLGRETAEGLSWERSQKRLGDLVGYGRNLGVCVCLENLAWGWTSRPELFEKLVRRSGSGVTLDIGHARVSPSIESQRFSLEDFVSPHQNRVYNAHIYHEETEDGHLPPVQLEDLRERLTLLGTLPCDWWVLELRNLNDLMATLKIVRAHLEGQPPQSARESHGVSP
jgi:sugar phosphate isomerase/epimerase